MKMIEDLGMQYSTPVSKRKKHFAIYECPYCKKLFRSCCESVNSGYTVSCGCYFKKRAREANFKHGLTDTRIHHTWRGIISRCFHENNPKFYRYGGRGITMCDEWKNDFMAFYNWSMANGYKDDLEIDRINNDGNYEPSNCRWVTRMINTQNRGLSRTNPFGYVGISKTKSGSWRTTISSSGIKYYIGTFYNPTDGAVAYNKWVTEHGTAHRLNVIIEDGQ